MPYAEWITKARRASRAAHTVLAVHETAQSRVVILEDMVKRLSGAPVDVQEYFKESIQCLESSLFRAAVVFSWAGHFDVFIERLFALHEDEIRSKRAKWLFKDLIELRERYPESQILDVGKEVRFISKAKLRIVQGQLSERNQCAHPTMYKPSLNAAIGYVDAMVSQSLSYM